MLVASPSLEIIPETETTSPDEYHPFSGASTSTEFKVIFPWLAKALGAMAARRPAKTIASIRSLPMVNHVRHPLEGMRSIGLVSEDG